MGGFSDQITHQSCRLVLLAPDNPQSQHNEPVRFRPHHGRSMAVGGVGLVQREK